MTPPASSTSRVRLLRWFVTALAVLASSLAAPAHAQKPKDPRITDVRIGFDGAYKLGCWTQVEVTLAAGDEPYTGAVEISVPDADGVPTSVVTPPERPVGLTPGQTTTARLFVRYGQDGADMTVRFYDDRGEECAKRTFTPGVESGGQYVSTGMPATNKLLVAFGGDRGLNELAHNDRDSPSGDDPQAVRAVRLDRAADLPVEWYGYEGVDVLVLSSSQPELYRPLAANPQRIAALRRWVELGGRLVIFCGVAAPELIGPDGPLAGLIPGKFDTIVPLRESSPLETFSGAAAPINRGRLDVEVPRLVDVEGRILAHAGNGPEDLPLVIRARRGFGEVTFVAVDPDAPPIANWTGRVGLLRQALQWPADRPDADAGANRYPNQGSEDLINLLRSALDRQFTGVKTAPFALVALLVIGYIALIGPGDYFLVKRMLKRMELTWITFPLIVLSVSAGAYYLAWWMKGDQLRVNQVEVVDVDLGSGQGAAPSGPTSSAPASNATTLRSNQPSPANPSPTPASRVVSTPAPPLLLQPPASSLQPLWSPGSVPPATAWAACKGRAAPPRSSTAATPSLRSSTPWWASPCRSGRPRRSSAAGPATSARRSKPRSTS